MGKIPLVLVNGVPGLILGGRSVHANSPSPRRHASPHRVFDGRQLRPGLQHRFPDMFDACALAGDNRHHGGKVYSWSLAKTQALTD